MPEPSGIAHLSKSDLRTRVLGTFLIAIVLAWPAAAADVRIVMADGMVTLSVTDATPREILTEWARVGRSEIVNIDGLAGAPMSIELVAVPEARALDTILRSTGGYLAVPRATPIPNASAYGRIFLAPTGAMPMAQAPSSEAAAPMVDQLLQGGSGEGDSPDGSPGARVRGNDSTLVQFFVPNIGDELTPSAVGSRVGGTPTPADTPAAPTRSGGTMTATPAGTPAPGMIVPVPRQSGAPGERVGSKR